MAPVYFSLNGITISNFYEFREWTNLNFVSHCHYTFEVVFVTEGAITIEKEKEVYTLTPGDAVAIMPFEKHSFVTDAQAGSRVFAFQISPKLISNWDLCFAGKTLKESRRRFSPAMLEELYHSLKDMDGNLIQLNGLFFRIIQEFLRDNELITAYQPDDLCLDALRYISEHFRKNITLKDVAKALNVNAVYLSRIFTKKIKFKFVDCVNSFRLQEATALLSSREKSISEICYECGFGSLRQFNRLFLRAMSCTPSEYRKKHSAIAERSLPKKVSV